jgi:CBS domain-containing protein
MHSLAALFRRRVGDQPLSRLVTVAPEDSAAAVVAAVAGARATAALVVDAENRPLGILTEQDIARRLAFRVAPDAPVGAVMTRPVETVSTDAYLYAAIAVMRRRNLRHMPVVDRAGRPTGMLDLHRAYAASMAGMMALIDALAGEDTRAGLAAVKRAQAELAEALFAEALPAPEIQALLTDLNADIYRTLADGAIRAMAEAGWGPPPLAFDVIVMGSGGRGESFLAPDQDNGFVIDAYPDDEHNRVDPWFIELAERLTRDLDAVGIPFCNGNVMATNPVWRKSLPQWLDQIALWGRRRAGQANLNADIFFDFKPVHGAGALTARLREGVVGLARGNRAMLGLMALDAADKTVALGWFGRLLAEHDKKDDQDKIDLKLRGTLPLIGSVRLLALFHGIGAIPTLDRLKALAAAGVLARDEEDYLAGAFRHITGLLLRQQIADQKAGRAPGNLVVKSALSEREKDILVDSLRAIELFQKRVRGDLTGSLA